MHLQHHPVPTPLMSNLLDTRAIPDALQRAERLPTLPGVAVEVLRLCKEEETTLDDLAEVIAHDPALSARLLRFANSSLYNLGQDVTTIQRACLVLGMKTVQLMSLSFSLAEMLPRSGNIKGFDYREFWRRSLVCAVAGRAMAGVAGLMSEDEAFLCGLLSHIGQIVMAECLPEEYGEIVSAAGARWPTAELEEEMLGFDRADVGAALLDSWSLPKIVTASVGAMHDPTRLKSTADRDTRDVVRVMHIADLTVELLTREDKGTILSQIEDRAQTWFELPPDTVYNYVTSLEAGITEASEMLNLNLPQGESHEKILEDARQQLVEISVGAARQLENSRHSVDLEHRKQILADPALRDETTGVPNNAAFERFFDQELIARLQGPLRRPLGLLYFELDEFQELTATFGVDAANEVLRMTGQALISLVRKGDLPARLSDARFAVIMSEGTPFGLRALAERLRRGIAGSSVECEGDRLSVTATLAGACLGQVQRSSDGKALRAAAEKLLKRAKSSERNHSLVHPTLLSNRD